MALVLCLYGDIAWSQSVSIANVSPNPAMPGHKVTVTLASSSGSGGGVQGCALTITGPGLATPISRNQPPPYIANIILPASISPGSYTVQVICTDSAGQTVSSSPVTLSVNLGTPTVTQISGVATLGSAVTVTGSGFGNTQGSGQVQLMGTNGAPNTTSTLVTFWSNTQIVFNVGSTGGAYQLVIQTDSNGSSAPFNLTVASPSTVSTSNGMNMLGPLETPVSVLTQRYNNKRTGANLQENVLTVQSVSSPDFQQLHSIPVTGQVYAQPLLVSQVNLPNGNIGDVLVIATMQNQVSAFVVDNPLFGLAFSPSLLWQTTLPPSVPANFMPMSYSSFTCFYPFCWPNSGPPSTPTPLPAVGSTGSGLYNIDPAIGCLSTPTVDSGSGTLYLACATLDPSGNPHTTLFALNLLTGAVLRSTQVGYTPLASGGGTFSSVPGFASDSVDGRVIFNETHQMQRPALLLQSTAISPGTIFSQLYLAFGSHQDTVPYHGWIFSYDPMTLQQTGVWCSTPNAIGGAIWQAGSGIVGDDAGNIYVMTGNGITPPDLPTVALPVQVVDNSSDAAQGNFANSFVELNASLNPIGNLNAQPTDNRQRDSEDIDLGSSGPELLPDMNILVGGDKRGLLWVLDPNAGLGSRQVFQAAQQQDAVSISGSGYHHIHGTPVLWRNSQGLMLYVWAERDFLRTYHWNDAQAVFDPGPMQESTMQSPPCYGCMPGGFLSISASGGASGTGVLWASLPFNNGTALPSPSSVFGGALNSVVPGILRALDADDLKHELWTSEGNASRDGNFMFAKNSPPVIANGRVYLATFGSIPSNDQQSMTGAVNIYGLRQWAKFLFQGASALSTPPMLLTGQSFTDQVVVQNVGTTSWVPGTQRLGAQDPQDNTTWGAKRFDLQTEIFPGQFAQFNLTLTAPSAPGTYAYQWRMVQEGVEWFGEFTPPVVITVISPP